VINCRLMLKRMDFMHKVHGQQELRPYQKVFQLSGYSGKDGLTKISRWFRVRMGFVAVLIALLEARKIGLENR
jgi:hypothetical protein